MAVKPSLVGLDSARLYDQEGQASCRSSESERERGEGREGKRERKRREIKEVRVVQRSRRYSVMWSRCIRVYAVPHQSNSTHQ